MNNEYDINLIKNFQTATLSPAQVERNKTKEQLEEEKKISLSIRIKPLAIDGLGVDKLREKANELWAQIVKLETEKYDLEERQKRQDYDVSIQQVYFVEDLNNLFPAAFKMFSFHFDLAHVSVIHFIRKILHINFHG